MIVIFVPNTSSANILSSLLHLCIPSNFDIVFSLLTPSLILIKVWGSYLGMDS